MLTHGLQARLRASVAFISMFSLVASSFVMPVSALAANPILNPGFETAGPANWQQDSYKPNGVADHTATFSIVTGAAAHNGAGNSAQVVVSGYVAGDAKWIFDSIPVTAGQYYTFTDYYKADIGTEVDAYFTPSTPGTQVFQRVGIAGAASDWTPFSGTILAPVTGTMTVAHVIVGNGTLTTDDYSLELGTAPVFSQGRVTLSFDDGWKTYADYAFPILNTAGLKSTAYIITLGNSTASTDYMATSTLTSLQASGLVEIGAHTRNHLDLVNDAASSTMLAQYNYADAAALWQGEINSARTDLTSQGFVVDTMAYPYGQYDTNVKGLVASAGYVGARSVDDGFNFTNTDKYALKQKHITNTTVFDAPGTEDDPKGWIDTAISQKTWVIMMFHDVWPTLAQCVDREHPDIADLDCTDTATLQQIVDYLKTKETAAPGTAVTVREGIAAMTTPPADTTAPVITVPADMEVVATSSTSIGAVATFTVTATDTNPANPAVTCTPASGSTFALGSTTVTCTASDAATPANTSSANFVVHVTAPAAPNNAPVANAQSVSLDKNTSKAITLTGSDADASDVLVFATSTSPSDGALSGTGANLTYTPTADYVGSDSFDFTVGDGKATTTATVSVTVNDVTPAPQQNSNGSGGGSSGGGGGGGVVLGLIGQVTTNGGGLVLGASTQTLTDAQINAILDLLRSFNADQSVIDNVSKSLHGQATGGSSTGFKFTKTLQLGSTGNDVTELQKRLTLEGVYKGPVTGTFGPLTKAGVIAYQKKMGLEQVGIVGPKTREALNK